MSASPSLADRAGNGAVQDQIEQSSEDQQSAPPMID
jgi:hypothetical protein